MFQPSCTVFYSTISNISISGSVHADEKIKNRNHLKHISSQTLSCIPATLNLGDFPTNFNSFTALNWQNHAFFLIM